MPNYLNQETLEKLKKKLKYLKNVERKEVAKQLEHAIEFGDLSENAAYRDAREAKELLEKEIFELGEKIQQTVIIKTSSKTDKVQIGSTIVVKSGKDKLTFKIVDTEEVDSLQGKISYDSPLGKAFLNKTKGAVVQVDAPTGKIEYKIIKIN